MADTLPDIIYQMASSRSLLPVSIDKVGLVKWRELQTRRMSIEELEAFKDAPAWAHITGKVSGIFTIDIDNTGMDWAKHKELDKLAHRSTPSGGLHIDVVLPRGWLVKNTVGSLSAGIDTRGEGGIALIWGRSRKGEYKWLRPISESPITFATLPKPTQWMLYEWCRWQEPRIVEVDFTIPPATPVEIESLLLKALAYAPASGRNAMGFWLACKLRDSRVDKEAARSVGYDYVNRVWQTNTHGSYEQYTRQMFDAALNNAYARVGR